MKLKNGFVISLVGLSATLLTGCGWISSHEMRSQSTKIMSMGNGVTAFPPSFMGHPLAYSGAVFSQLTIFSLALAIIFYMLNGLNIKRDSCRAPNGKRCWNSPVNVYRVSMILFMITVIFGSGPNLLTYLAWGEVTDKTMTMIFTVEKIFKGLAVIPFLTACYLWVRNDTEITYAMICPEPICLGDTWTSNDIVKRHRKSVGLILLLAVGVTYAKWGAAVAV